MERDSSATKERIVQAVGTLLAERGFSGIGVNAIARAAGVDKVLLYRYFGSLPELLRAYGKQGSFWPTIREQLGDMKEIATGSLAKLAMKVLVGHLRWLRQRPQTQEIMRWELHERNELTDELARTREQQGMEILELLPPAAQAAHEVDLPAVAALIHAGITYLVLRSKTADVYLGVDLRSEAGWKRIEGAIARMTEAVLGRGKRED
jgi:AcrR family transcriptional regulator